MLQGVMSLSLSFRSGSATRAARVAGPYAWLRFQGPLLSAGDGSEWIARHRDNAWETPFGVYARLDCEAPVCIRFEGRDPRVTSRLFGPFRSMSMIDGFAYVDGRNVFAFVHTRTADWFPYDDGNYWPVMVVEPA
jgi:hypothetical protein